MVKLQNFLNAPRIDYVDADALINVPYARFLRRSQYVNARHRPTQIIMQIFQQHGGLHGGDEERNEIIHSIP